MSIGDLWTTVSIRPFLAVRVHVARAELGIVELYHMLKCIEAVRAYGARSSQSLHHDMKP